MNILGLYFDKSIEISQTIRNKSQGSLEGRDVAMRRIFDMLLTLDSANYHIIVIRHYSRKQFKFQAPSPLFNMTNICPLCHKISPNIQLTLQVAWDIIKTLIVNWLTIYSERRIMDRITDKQLVRRLIAINRMHMKCTENSVSSLGIHRSQHHMLMHISHNSGINQKDLANQMEISTAAVAVTVKKLEQAGLIKRTSPGNDSRINNLSLTEKGEQIVKDTAEEFSRIDECMLKGITDSERQTLWEILDKLKTNLCEMNNGE